MSDRDSDEKTREKDRNKGEKSGWISTATRFFKVGKGKGIRRAIAVASGVVVVLGAIGEALDFFPKARDAINWGLQATTEDLPDSFPGESWKKAKLSDFDWLQDEWCYPGMPDFRIQFRVTNGMLEQQNRISGRDAHVTEWVQPKVYISNRGVLRLMYENDWPGDYIDFVPKKTAEWHEYVRYANADGSITAGHERLVLSCRRCRVGKDGTYSCS